jgi:polysaccharide chain length determinant protein (PEP-CTERM system associated)
MSARNYTFDEVWNLALRHRWLVLIPVAIGVAAAPFLSQFAPLRYRSEALILVVPPQVPGTYVQQTVTESVEDRLPGITAQILSRSRLERIIVDMDLYREERSRQVMEDVVEQMRTRDIQTTPSGRQIDSFRVSYVNDDPGVAQKVTERLTQFYIDQNTLDRTNQAESTSSLLANQIESTKQRLSELDKKLEVYRKAHPGELPSQLQANLQNIQNLNSQLNSVNEQINRATERRLLLERDLASLDLIPLPPSPVNTANPAEVLTTAEQLELARARVADLRQRYKPGFPQLDEAERLVAQLTSRLENETPLSARTAVIEKPMSTAEAGQKSRRLTLEAQLEVIDLQLTTDRAEAGRIKRLIAGYQAKVDAVPTRESELIDLTREYNTLNAAYSDLLLKRENASLAANAERREIGERFEILDPASRPERPYNELQRLGISSSGAIAGLVLALLVIGLREYRDSSFRTKDEVLTTLSLPVLASIPLMASAREREAVARRRWALDLAGSAVVVGSVAFVVVWELFS